MKGVSIVSTTIVFIGLLLLLVRVVRHYNWLSRSNATEVKPELKPQVPYRQQLEIFRQLHFDLNPGVDSTDIVDWSLDDNDVEEQPFTSVYTMLGSCIEREPYTPFTNRCWNFDTEAIEDHGAYVDIIRNLERISRGALIFTDLKDYVDIDEGVAWVSFTFNGHHYKWNMRVNDDWVDDTLFQNIVMLTEEHNTNGRFTILPSDDQTMVIGFETEASLAEIKRATGLPIDWLE